MTHLYLDDSDTLLVNKQLACAVGLNNSIILRQIHYWLCLNQKAKSERHFHDNCWWTFNTYDEWTLENFPFWSMDTVRRAIIELTDSYGLVEIGHYNERRGDQTKWYTINYQRYAAFIELWKQNGSPNVSDRKIHKAYIPIWQLAMGNIASCIGQHGNLPRPLPEINSETNADKKKNAPKRAASPSKKKVADTPIPKGILTLQPSKVELPSSVSKWNSIHFEAFWELNKTVLGAICAAVGLDLQFKSWSEMSDKERQPYVETCQLMNTEKVDVPAYLDYFKKEFAWRKPFKLSLGDFNNNVTKFQVAQHKASQPKIITGLWGKSEPQELPDVGLTPEQRKALVASTKKAVSA